MSKEAIIIGYSGHAFVVIENILANGYHIIGYCDKIAKESNPFRLAYLGYEREIYRFDKFKNKALFIAIGDNQTRANVFQHIENNSLNFPNVIHPSATVSPSVVLGSATVIMPGVVINAYAKIGSAVICNTSAVIEHECTIGDYVHIAPGAVLSGNVTIGNYSFIGANAVIKQGITIGSNVVIGAGSVVIKDIPDGTMVYGNPAKIKVYE